MMCAAVVAGLSGSAGAEPRYASVGVSPEARPLTLSQDVRNLKDVDKVQTDELDFAAAMLESERNVQVGLPLRFAIPVRVNYSPANAGTWEELKNGMRLWRLRVGADGALSINLGFTRFHLPPGASMTLLTPDGTEVIRPFTEADHQPTGQLWTPILNSDEIVIEVVVPEKLIGEFQLQIGQIGAGFRRFGVTEAPAEETRGTSGSCNVDVACPEGNPWADEIDAAGAFTLNGIDTCSGSMVNNTSNDRTPYFLTAFHCGVDAGDAGTMVIYWNFQNSYCRVPGSGDSGGPGDGSLAQFSSGATFRAGASVSDFTLVQVNTPPPQSFGVTFAGWSREGLNPASGACIHHPQVAEKRISFYDTAGGSFAPSHGSSWPCTAAPGPGDNTHISVYWSLGVTEPGSSGSPLYDNNQRIIGQLHGGPSSCSQTGANRSDCYGRVSRSWTGNGTAATRLSDWLDPTSTGAMVVDTLGPGMSVTPTGDVTHLGLLGGPFTPASVSYTLTNPTPTPVNYSVSLVGGGTAPLTLDGGPGPVSGSLAAMGSVNVIVAVDPAANALPAGVYSTTVSFQDTTNGVMLSRIHTIDAGTTGFDVTPATGLLGGGPVGGPFSATQAYTITSTKPTPVNVTVAGSAPWIAVDGLASTSFTLSAVGASQVVIAGFSVAANALGAGIYNGTVNVTNDSGGTGGTTRPVTLDVGRYTYTYAGPPIPITDNSAFNSTLSVPDAFCIGDVDVEIDITHTFRGDLIVELTSPQGTTVRLHNRTGGSADNLIVTYDQGVVNPDGPGALTDFNGQGAQGVWTLRVSDNAGGDVGSLNLWKLKIAQSGTPCPPTAKNFAVTVPDTVITPVALQGVSTTNAPLTYTIQSLPASGTLRDPTGNVLISAVPYTLLAGGGTVNYKPNALYIGPDSFTYSCDDGLPSSTGAASISVGIAQPVVTWNMDANPGWTYGANWAYGVPQGLSGDPASGFTGANVVGYNLAGDYANNAPRTYATTPAIDLTGKFFTVLEFRRWLGIESSTFDQAGIEISTNGTTWTPVWAHAGASLNEAVWSLQTFNLSAIADNQPTVFLRWYLGTTDGSVVFHGWNIDDVVIKGVMQPTVPPLCPGDADDDNDVDFADVTATLANFGANYLPTPGTGIGDADDDGDVDFADITTELALFGTSCP
jgi:subtilisin-like proprotein convertase family protein